MAEKALAGKKLVTLYTAVARGGDVVIQAVSARETAKQFRLCAISKPNDRFANHYTDVFAKGGNTILCSTPEEAIDVYLKKQSSDMEYQTARLEATKRKFDAAMKFRDQWDGETVEVIHTDPMSDELRGYLEKHGEVSNG